MKKFKLDKNNSKKFVAVALSGLIAMSVMSFGGCTKDSKKDNDAAIVQVETSNEALKRQIRDLFPTLGEDVVENSALIILLEEIAKADENGKISSEYISLFKSKVDVDNMISDYNSFINVLEQTMINSNQVVKVNDLVIDSDKEIMTKLELITSKIISGTKEEKNKYIELIYSLFVEEKEVEVDGLTFEIIDLSHSSRTIASAYARTCAYYAKDIITDDKYKAIDDRTNDQNNKSEIKITLEVLSNQMNEESKVDVQALFNNKSEEVKNILDGKVKVTDENRNNLINYINIEYLNSDEVANKDKNLVLGEYADKDMLAVLDIIDAITAYNQKNPNNIILFSSLLVDEYANTAKGKEDAVALDFIQYNIYMFLSTTKEDSTFDEIYNNPYLQNINDYLCGRNFTHSYNEEKSVVVDWQDISDGVKLVCNEMILNSLSKRKNIMNVQGYEEKMHENLEDSIRSIKIVITGECQKVDMNVFVKKK